MGDLYSELLVKKDKTAKDSLLKYGLIVLTVLAVFAGLIITPLALIIAVALGIACYFVIPKTDVEYEYLFINGDFDIDMIMSKTKRKKVIRSINALVLSQDWTEIYARSSWNRMRHLHRL